MDVKVKKLVPEAVLPKRAHASDAGFDLVAVSRKVDEDGAIVYGTGLAFEIPEGYVGLVFPRSSIARKDLVLSNGVGVIDAGYRGEVMAKFRFVDPLLTHEAYDWYGVGDRIAQLVIAKHEQPEVVEVQTLSETERGAGGFGHTGV